jgi:hypothetical protein
MCRYRYELQQFDTAIKVLERLCRAKRGRLSKGSEGDATWKREKKWIDLLIKSYVKASRTGDAVSATTCRPLRASAGLAYVHRASGLSRPWHSRCGASRCG